MARKKEKTEENEKEVQSNKAEKKERGSSRRSSGRRSSSTVRNKGSKSNNPVIRYFQETAEELRKVTWPTPEQTRRLSVIVLIGMLVFTVFLGSLDFLFQQLIKLFV